MAKLLVPREKVKQALEVCIRAGDDLVAKAEVAERTAGYRDWLELVAAWRDETASTLNRLYEGTDIARQFAYMAEATTRSSPRYTFPYSKMRLQDGINQLQSLIERLELAVGASGDATALGTLHPKIYAKVPWTVRER